MMKLRRSSTNEEEGNQSGKRSERDQRRGEKNPSSCSRTYQPKEGNMIAEFLLPESSCGWQVKRATLILKDSISCNQRVQRNQAGMWSGSAQDICTPAAEIHMLRLVEGRNTSGTCGVGKATLNKCITLGGDVRMQRALSLSRHVPSGISHHLLR
ncbi:uncharacterized protein LOC124401350 isoform X17 [Silurus meridionalis]|uniref:uncharacterized protein LOC124401350 isoform X17 n=1 Tax=Silurus meridionalis TaxID=175797 RepID=UPI001EEC5038|nr:uncharacterized protein LOC124401350 isoform X17 [Silurus meridionalis]